MDVRVARTEPVMEHADTIKAYFMFDKDELYDKTLGSHLEFINEFTIDPGVRIEPHYHNSHEFYYLLEGEGTMQIAGERRDVRPRDLVYIPPNVPHSMWSTVEGQGIRAFCFAASFQDKGEGYTVSSLPDFD